MIDRELRAKIVRLYTQESWKPNAIAKQLQVHHSTVQNLSLIHISEPTRPY